MVNKNSEVENLINLMYESASELESEIQATMSPEERKLDNIAREIIRLERDMTVPGSQTSQSNRIERLMSFIEDRDF